MNKFSQTLILLGKRIKELRLEQNMSIKDLSIKSNEK